MARESVAAQIQKLAARRQAIWAGAPREPGEVTSIERRLAALYEDLRIERARDRSGMAPKEIQRRAKLDHEIERLIGNA